MITPADQYNANLLKKWKDVLDVDGMPPIRDAHRRLVTATLLEHTAKDLASKRGQLITEDDAVPTNVMSGISTYDPILISLVRRSAPALVAYDICGVQPMTGPTGLIFALRAHYANQTGNEAFYYEPNTSFSTVVTGNTTVEGQGQVGTVPGSTTVTSNLVGTNTYNFAQGMSRAQLEALGATGNTPFPEMAISIEKVTVTALARALKAEYSLELAQDMKAIHGLDADAELTNILSVEIMSEINREVVRTVNVIAKPGSQVNTNTAGVYDLDIDANGRWSVERFKGMLFQIEREANQIAFDTRRGKGNILICTADVASALQMAGVLDFAPALQGNQLEVDVTGTTFAGVLNGRIRVYIDPYGLGPNNLASGQYFTMGFKGASPMDAGLFYCPYIPLQMVRAVGDENFQPKIGFKTRYGMVANPFANGAYPDQGFGALTPDANVYYRRTIINNLM